MPYSSEVPRCVHCSCSRPTRPERSRKTTRSSPMIRMRRGTSPRSRAKATGCQKRRRYSPHGVPGSEEHTSELQSQSNLVCRLLLEKKKKKKKKIVEDTSTQADQS